MRWFKFCSISKSWVSPWVSTLARGFVQQQQAGFAGQGPGDQHPLALSAGNWAKRRWAKAAMFISSMAVWAARASRAGNSAPGRTQPAHQHHVPHRDRELRIVKEMLGNISGQAARLAGRLPEKFNLALRGLEQAQNQFQEGGFSASVGADDADELLVGNVQADVLQNAARPVVEGHILQ